MTAAKNTYTRKAKLDTDNVHFDTPSQDVDHSRMKTTGIALPDARGIESDVFTRNVKELLSEEAFMAQRIEVIFAEPGNEWEPQFVEATVNGEPMCERRGDAATVKRSHLAVIATAKQERLRQVKITLPDGSMGYEEKSVLQQVYPFQVISDPAGARGVTWLRTILQRS